MYEGFLNGQCIENELWNENPVVIHNIPDSCCAVIRELCWLIAANEAYNRDTVSSFDIFCSCETDLYKAYGGDGSYGSDGIIYVIDKKTNLPVWFLFLDSINPIEKIKIIDGVIYAYNNNGYLLISIATPLNNIKFIEKYNSIGNNHLNC